MYKYERVIWWSDKYGHFLAEVPELPGCVADGDTIIECANHLEESIKLWIEVNTEKDIPIPSPKKKVW